MTDLLETVLLQGLSSELRCNRIAAILYGLVDSGKIFTSNRMDVIVELIKGNPPKDENLITKTTINSPEFKDMRLHNLVLCNIKKYPGSISENKFYGISFADENDNARNSVFIGSNGVGKTSLYAALEYAGMRKMNTAAIRGYSRKIGQQVDVTVIPEKDQSEFLLHSGSGITESSIRMLSKSDALILDGKDLESASGKPLVTEAFFCSDYDVRSLEVCKDYTEYFLKQTGLSHLYKCLQDLYAVRRYVDYYDKINADFPNISKFENDEIKNRFLMGIADGRISLDDNTFEDDGVLDDKLLGYIQEQDVNRQIKLLKELRDILIQEVRKLPKGNWHSLDLKIRYCDCISFLSRAIKSITKKPTKSVLFYPQKLEQFILFRKDVKRSVIELSRELKSGISTRKRINFVNSLNELYIIARNNVENVLIEKAKNRLFDRNEDRIRFDKEYAQLARYFEKYLNDTFNYWFPKLKESVELLLKEYFDIDNDILVLDYNIIPSQSMIIAQNQDNPVSYLKGVVHPFLEIKVDVMSSRGMLNEKKRYPMPPRAYLNTFKFKLFCITLKLALCCFVKKNFNMNFPLIIDDVFDSSDFDNRIKLKDFVKYMIEQHNKLLQDEKFKPQIIFFTQDDLIADQVYRGICEASTNEKAKLSLIFDYHECDEKDIVNKKFKGDNYTYKSVEDVITRHN